MINLTALNSFQLAMMSGMFNCDRAKSYISNSTLKRNTEAKML